MRNLIGIIGFLSVPVVAMLQQAGMLQSIPDLSDLALNFIRMLS